MRLSIKLSLFLFFAGISLIALFAMGSFIFVSDKKLAEHNNSNTQELTSIFLGKVVTNGQYICQVKNDSLIFKTQKDVKAVKSFLESLGSVSIIDDDENTTLFYGEKNAESVKKEIQNLLTLSDCALYVRNESTDSFVKIFSTEKFFDDKNFSVKNSLGSITSAKSDSELFNILESDTCEKIVVLNNKLFFTHYVPVFDSDGKVVAALSFYFVDSAFREVLDFFESKKLAEESFLWIANLNEEKPKMHINLGLETFTNILRRAEKLGAGEWEKISFTQAKNDYICAFSYYKDWNIIIGAVSNLKYLVEQETLSATSLSSGYLIVFLLLLICVVLAYLFAKIFAQSFKILFVSIENSILHKETFIPLNDKFFIGEFSSLASSVNVMNKSLSVLLWQVNSAKETLLQSARRLDDCFEKIKSSMQRQSKILFQTKSSNSQVEYNLSDSKNTCFELESESSISLKIAKKDFANLSALKKDSINFKDAVGEFVSKILALKATAENLHSKISVIADYSHKSKDFASLNNLADGEEKYMMEDLGNLYANTAETLKNSEALLGKIKSLLDDNIQDLNMGILNMGKNIAYKEKSLDEINSLFLRLELLTNKFQDIGHSFSVYENNLSQITKTTHKISREILESNSNIDDLKSLSHSQSKDIPN